MKCSNCRVFIADRRKVPPRRPQSLQMAAAEYREALARYEFGQEGFAIALGYSGRAGQRWASGEAKVPGAVCVILRLLDARPEMAAVLAKIAPLPEAKKKKPGRRARRPR